MPFSDIEALCLLLVWLKLRKLNITNAREGRNGFHAYAWGCYFHIFIHRYS